MDINLTEALLCTRAPSARTCLLRRSGKVIIPRVVDRASGRRDLVLYTTAKTALAGFTRAQALEWAPYGVHVNAIAPGIFPDVVTSGEEPREADHAARGADRAAQAAGAAAEVGLLALYLASNASDYMTGQTILLDGGLGLQRAGMSRRNDSLLHPSSLHHFVTGYRSPLPANRSRLSSVSSVMQLCRIWWANASPQSGSAN